MPGSDRRLLVYELFCFLSSLAQALGKHWQNEQTAAFTSGAGLLSGKGKDSNPEVLGLKSQSPLQACTPPAADAWGGACK